MLLSPVANWLKTFDHVDVKAPIYDFDGLPQSFEYLLDKLPAKAEERMSSTSIADRFAKTAQSMARLETDLHDAHLDVLIIIGDDQMEIFKDECRPAIAVYYGDTIRNAAAPSPPPSDWYYFDQTKRLEDGKDVFYPCAPAMGMHLIDGLTNKGFDLTAVKTLTASQYEGHAYSFIHRRYMAARRIPVVPVLLNTYYPPNVPTPQRCLELGIAIRELVDSFPQDLRVGIMASGGLSHFLVNEDLDAVVIDAIRRNDISSLAALSPQILQSGSSEIRNWICTGAAASKLKLAWLNYVPAYRSRAMTGVGLCFATWLKDIDVQ